MTGGDKARGARLALTALDRLGAADPATRAWPLARHAEETALLADHRAAPNSIHQVEEVYATADITARPWTCFLDATRFATMKLTVHSRLRREDDTITAMDEIVSHLSPQTELKKLCVAQAELALAHLRLGDVTEAVKSAKTALSATATMAHPLGWERLDHVIAELEPLRAQAARELRAEYAAVRPTSAPSSRP